MNLMIPVIHKRRTFQTWTIKGDSAKAIEEEALRQARKCFGDAYRYRIVPDYCVHAGIPGVDDQKYWVYSITVKVIPRAMFVVPV